MFQNNNFLSDFQWHEKQTFHGNCQGIRLVR